MGADWRVRTWIRETLFNFNSVLSVPLLQFGDLCWAVGGGDRRKYQICGLFDSSLEYYANLALEFWDRENLSPLVF